MENLFDAVFFNMFIRQIFFRLFKENAIIRPLFYFSDGIFYFFRAFQIINNPLM